MAEKYILSYRDQKPEEFQIKQTQYSEISSKIDKILNMLESITTRLDEMESKQCKSCNH